MSSAKRKQARGSVRLPSTPDHRLCEYTLHITLKDINTFLDTENEEQMVLSSKTIHNSEIRARYPLEEHADYIMDVGCKIFAYPGDLRFTRLPQAFSVHSFVSTRVDGAKTYGFCCTRYRKLRSTDDFFFPEVLCVHARFAYIELIETLLKKYPFPTLKEDEGFPDQLLPSIYNYLNGHQHTNLNTNPKELPIVNVDYSILYRYIHPNNIIKILNGIMLERKILFYGNKDILVSTIESLLSLLYPFEWPNIYIPIAPSIVQNGTDMTHVLIETCFMPFIIGLCKESLDNKDNIRIPKDVIVIDIENNKIDMGDDLYIPWPYKQEQIILNANNDYALSVMFPNIPQDRDDSISQIEVNKLGVPDGMSCNTILLMDSNNNIVPSPNIGREYKLTRSISHGWILKLVNNVNPHKNKERGNTSYNDVIELRTRMLNVISSLFRHYDEFVNIPSEEQMEDIKFQFFDNEGFMGSTTESCQTFLNHFVKGQMWSWFLQEYCFKTEEDIFMRKSRESREIYNNILESQTFQEVLWTMQCDLGGDGDRPIYLVQVEMSTYRLNFWGINEDSTEDDFIANPDDMNLMILAHFVEINESTLLGVPLDIYDGFPLTVNTGSAKNISLYAETAEARRSLLEAIRCIVLKKRKLTQVMNNKHNQARKDQLSKVLGTMRRKQPNTNDIFNNQSTRTIQRSFSTIYASQPPSPRLLYAEFKRHAMMQEQELNEDIARKESLDAKKKNTQHPGTIGRRMNKLFNNNNNNNNNRGELKNLFDDNRLTKKKITIKPKINKVREEMYNNSDSDVTSQLRVAALSSYSSIVDTSSRLLERLTKMQKTDGIFIDSVLKSLILSAEEGMITEESILSYVDSNDAGDAETYAEGMVKSIGEIGIFAEELLKSVNDINTGPEELKKNLILLSQMAKVLKGTTNF